MANAGPSHEGAGATTTTTMTTTLQSSNHNNNNNNVPMVLRLRVSPKVSATGHASAAAAQPHEAADAAAAHDSSATNDASAAAQSHVSWHSDVIDNEFLDTKSSKKCWCVRLGIVFLPQPRRHFTHVTASHSIFHKPKEFGESSSESDSDWEGFDEGDDSANQAASDSRLPRRPSPFHA